MPDKRMDIINSLNEVDKSQADLCRTTGINYKRLNGGIMGYWYFTQEESYKIRQVISGWKREKVK